MLHHHARPEPTHPTGHSNPASPPNASRSRSARPHPSPFDLRRIKSRDLIDAILARAEHLPEADAALLRAVYDRGLSVANLALTTNADARALRKRVRSLVARVMDPTFMFITTHAAAWPEVRRRVSTLCLIQGLSVREAAARLSVSDYTVRKNLLAVRTLTESAR